MSMADEKFTSRYRKTDNTRTDLAKDRRKVLEDGGEHDTGSAVSTSSRSSGVSISVRAGKTERTESPTHESVVSRMNKLNARDERADGSDNEDGDEEDDSKKSSKKDRHGGASGTSSRKRAARKHLREKRRSTGVVIMPGQQIAPADEEERTVQENTLRNQDEEAAVPEPVKKPVAGSENVDGLTKQLEAYEQAIEEWKDAYEKAQKEIDALRSDNMRLKDENSALLRVVGSLSGGHGGHGNPHHRK